MMRFWEYIKRKESLKKELLDKYGPYRVFLVNGNAVRDMSQAWDEFTQFSTHNEMPRLVPKNEIWIARNAPKKERQFFIVNGLSQFKAKEDGKRNWYNYAKKKERWMREVVDGLKFRPQTTNEKPPDKVYSEYYCGIPNPNDDVEVWLVNGEVVRDLFKTDFMEGTNGEVTKFTPRQEIWIEDNLSEDEINLTILHEYVENTLMRVKKFPYDKAHNIASQVDWHHRGKKWDKTDVQALNREEALELAKPYL